MLWIVGLLGWAGRPLLGYADRSEIVRPPISKVSNV